MESIDLLSAPGGPGTPGPDGPGPTDEDRETQHHALIVREPPDAPAEPDIAFRRAYRRESLVLPIFGPACRELLSFRQPR